MIALLSRHRLLATWLLWLSASAFAAESPENPAERRELPALDVAIEAGETHRYPFAVRAGDAVQIDVRQQGIDLTVTLRDSTGRDLLTIDSPNGKFGTEQILIAAPRAGVLGVEIVAPGGAGRGRYSARLHPPSPVTPEFSAAVEADQNDRRAWQLVLRSAYPQAIEAYAEALHTWRSRERERRRADSAGMSCALLLDIGRTDDARDICGEALALYRAHGPEDLLAKTLLDSGLLQLRLGQPDRAMRLLLEAEPKIDALEDLEAAAQLWSWRGLAHVQLGEFGNALGAFEESLAISRRAALEAQEAHTSTDLAGLLLQLRRPRQAMGYLHRARDFYRREGRQEYLGNVEWRLAEAQRQLGDFDAAEASIRQAIGRHLASPNLRARTLDFYSLGQILNAKGDAEGAHKAYQSALTLSRELRDPRTEALVRAHLGYQKTRMGRIEEGLEALDEACESLSRLRDTTFPTRCRARLAEALTRLGRHSEAWREIEPVLADLEQHRASLDLRDLRLSYFDFRQDYFDLALGILAQLDHEQPEAGWDRRALRVHERRLALEIRGANPRSGAPSLRDGSLLPAEIDPHTLVLVFALRPDGALLWAIEGNRVELHRLAPATDLEGEVASFVSALSRSNRRSQDRARKLGASLFRALLSPVAERLAGQRLVVVADGALASLPFGALRTAADPPRYLLEDHEIVAMPSLDSVHQLRRRSEAGEPGPRSITVVADPIFSFRDPRVFEGPHAAEGFGSFGPRKYGLLERLPGTAIEAERIRELAAPEPVAMLTGSAATRERFFAIDFESVDILHLATHGLHSPFPERTGLVLSLVDPDGESLEGFLPASEVASLHLPTDLVVLSACASVLGPSWRGEGSTGLAWSFLVAGASRVVSTLWKVSDQQTAAWMEGFYHALLIESQTPSRAFREAQLALMRRSGSVTADWAGFQFAGDWRALPPSSKRQAPPL